ncbi:MAG: Gldg family protein, partial [Myxococcales bacterium]|nr:Gldg family protein [Myxococcales bacterium]
TSRAAHRTALICQAVGSGALLVWALTTGPVTDALGLTGESLDRWIVSWSAVFPILALAGGIPMLLLDQALAAHPVAMPSVARTQAVASGVALAFGVALVFPVNYLAAQHDMDWDVSYFRVTDPGQSTLALVGNLSEPVEILLFYPPNSDTKEQMVPYFEELAAASGGKLVVQVHDQPTVPALAKELTVRDNGYVVLRRGDATQKFKVDEDLKKARRDLKKLDGTVQKHLLKLVKDKRIAYVLTGHGEAGPRDANPFFKLGELKQALIAQNYDVKDYGLDEGSAEAVPDDAAFVIVAAPETSLFPEEVKALEAYVDRGGSLLVYADPGRDRMTDLLGYLGVTVGEHPLANASRY